MANMYAYRTRKLPDIQPPPCVHMLADKVRVWPDYWDGPLQIFLLLRALISDRCPRILRSITYLLVPTLLKTRDLICSRRGRLTRSLRYLACPDAPLESWIYATPKLVLLPGCW